MSGSDSNVYTSGLGDQKRVWRKKTFGGQREMECLVSTFEALGSHFISLTLLGPHLK